MGDASVLGFRLRGPALCPRLGLGTVKGHSRGLPPAGHWVSLTFIRTKTTALTCLTNSVSGSVKAVMRTTANVGGPHLIPKRPSFFGCAETKFKFLAQRHKALKGLNRAQTSGFVCGSASSPCGQGPTLHRQRDRGTEGLVAQLPNSNIRGEKGPLDGYA